MRLAQNLETIADAQHFSALVGKFNNTLHHGTKTCNSTATQVIAIGKPARQDQAIILLKTC